MKLKLLTPLLLIVSTLFFIANANAETLNTNIAGLVVKDIWCSSKYSGRLVNRNNHSLGNNKSINITMYDSDGDRVGVQSTRLKLINAKESQKFYTTTKDSSCNSDYKISITIN